VIGNAVHVMRIATGEIEESISDTLWSNKRPCGNGGCERIEAGKRGPSKKRIAARA
jgi:hypothetical protein